MQPHQPDEPDPPGVPDVVRAGLAILFCGINPGALSGELGQHFARPGNRFWKVLYQAGLTDRVLVPAQQWELLDLGIGITNLVPRTTRAASEVTPDELRAGAAALDVKVAALRPRCVAVLGVLAYRRAFQRPNARIGVQDETVGRGSALWVLPNPSGLQARYQLAEMAAQFGDLRSAAGIDDRKAAGVTGCDDTAAAFNRPPNDRGLWSQADHNVAVVDGDPL
jgi:double-stranded uracil-DNA glycosylase